jgi:O-antigen ligase
MKWRTRSVKKSSRLPVFGLLLVAFAGFVKGSPLVQKITPVDPTFIGASVVTAAVVFALLRHESRATRGIWLIVMVWASFLIGLPGDQWNDYTQRKVVALFALSLPCAIGAMVLLRTPRARAAYLGGIVALGILVAVLSIVSPDPEAQLAGRLAVDGSNTIAAGLATGAAVVALFSMALGRTKRRGLAIASGLALSVFMIGSGSRGPLLAAIAATIVVSAFSSGARKVKRLALGLGMLALAWWLTSALQLVSARLTTTTDTSSEARRRLWSEGISLVWLHPLGIGWGNLDQYLSQSARLTSGITQYPHNLILEVFTESSWVAGVILVAVLAKAFLRQRAAATTPVEMAMLGLFVFFVQSAMVSGDINDNRGVWVALGGGLAAIRANHSATSITKEKRGSPADPPGETLGMRRPLPALRR